ncbi:MAG TPA: cyclic nucleotide-binding domain-containing protein [Candidatus Acidoferrum sp.]|jgi:CRP-like cAMP-binding protein|nr:cyclic nucleotide-binding domain-containing protein [Candidatus Acidoferrum sp.]
MSTPDLRGVRILADMTNQQVGALLSYGEVLRFAPGDKIVRQGDPADALFLLMDGTTGAYFTDARGNETHLRTTETGGHFGEIGVLESGVRTATVKATTACVAFRMDAQQFRNLLKAPELATPLLHGLSRSLAIRLADITNRFSELRALKDVWLV